MAVLNKEDFFNKIKERIGEDNSDDALSFIEDITDTYNDMENKANDTTDWKTKYVENDLAWKTKYKERFFNNSSDNDETFNNDSFNETSKKITNFEDLFVEKEI